MGFWRWFRVFTPNKTGLNRFFENVFSFRCFRIFYDCFNERLPKFIWFVYRYQHSAGWNGTTKFSWSHRVRVIMTKITQKTTTIEYWFSSMGQTTKCRHWTLIELNVWNDVEATKKTKTIDNFHNHISANERWLQREMSYVRMESKWKTLFDSIDNRPQLKSHK